jgi:hypothetical protein
MYQPVTDYSYLAEIKLVNTVAAGTRVPFLDIPQLRLLMKGVKTVGLQCMSRTDLTVSPNSNTVVNVLTGMVLTIAVEGSEGSGEDVYQWPCNDLRSAVNSGLIRMLKDKRINFPKSYITILDATGLAQNEAVVFNIIYRK